MKGEIGPWPGKVPCAEQLWFQNLCISGLSLEAGAPEAALLPGPPAWRTAPLLPTKERLPFVKSLGQVVRLHLGTLVESCIQNSQGSVIGEVLVDLKKKTEVGVYFWGHSSLAPRFLVMKGPDTASLSQLLLGQG